MRCAMRGWQKGARGVDINTGSSTEDGTGFTHGASYSVDSEDDFSAGEVICVSL